jgi:hypothetical protein
MIKIKIKIKIKITITITIKITIQVHQPICVLNEPEQSQKLCIVIHLNSYRFLLKEAETCINLLLYYTRIKKTVLLS